MTRIQGSSNPPEPFGRALQPAFDRQRLQELQTELLGISNLQPQPRGFAFEKFLKTFFTLHGLEARDAFRLSGEQIDGSFQLGNETYLLEAKWQGTPVGVGDLHTFHGKIEQKAAWARGLFVSNSGFSEEGLCAFGRGKRVICMDGLDIYEILHRELPLNVVLERRIPRAAETGDYPSCVYAIYFEIAIAQLVRTNPRRCQSSVFSTNEIKWRQNSRSLSARMHPIQHGRSLSLGV